MQTPRRSFGYRIYIGHGRAASVLLTVHFFSSGEEFFMRASTGGNLQSAIRNPQSAIRNPQLGCGRSPRQVFRDLAAHHGFPSVAVAKAGCLSFSKRELMGHDEFHVLHVLKELVESSVTFDPILLTETWDPGTSWQFGRAKWQIGSEKPKCSPALPM
jgi:hypothetical protein